MVNPASLAKFLKDSVHTYRDVHLNLLVLYLQLRYKPQLSSLTEKRKFIFSLIRDGRRL